MSFTKLLSDLKQKRYKPVYVLHGEEDHFIDEVTNYISNNALEESARGFDQVTMYGLDTDVHQLIARLKQYPVLGQFQVVILKEAQRLKDFKSLENYFNAPAKTTVFVVAYKSKTTIFRKGSKLTKAIESNGILLESKKLYDNQVPAWIQDQLAPKKIKINPDASALITEFVGTNLSKLNNELNKLIINIGEDKTITSKMIEENIGISRDYNVFELQNALGKRNTQKVFRIITHFAKNPKDNTIMKTLPSLFGFYSKLYQLYGTKDHSKGNVASICKINPYFAGDYLTALRNYTPAQLENIIGILSEYDLRSKGMKNVNVKDIELQKEMIYKILAA